MDITTLVDPTGKPLFDPATGAFPTVLKGSNAPTNIVSGGTLIPWGDGTQAPGMPPSSPAKVFESLQDGYGGAGAGQWSAAGAPPSATDDTNGVQHGLVVVDGYDAVANATKHVRVVPGTGTPSTPYSGTSSVAITTATTTAVKASGGVVGTLSNASSAVTGNIQVFDNTSATGKMVWQGTLAAGQVLPLGIPCGTGITIVTAAADAIAVSFA